VLWQDRCEAIHGRFGGDILSPTIPPEHFTRAARVSVDARFGTPTSTPRVNFSKQRMRVG